MYGNGTKKGHSSATHLPIRVVTGVQFWQVSWLMVIANGTFPYYSYSGIHPLTPIYSGATALAFHQLPFQVLTDTKLFICI